MQLPRQGYSIARGRVSGGAWKGAGRAPLGEGVNPSFIGNWVKKAACRACNFACDRLPVGSGLCKRVCSRTVC